MIKFFTIFSFLLSLFFCVTYNSISQDKINNLESISEKDRRGIQERAWLLTKEYEILLSQISNSSMYPQEVQLIIKNSYSGEVSRLFEDENVIVEEDLYPNRINLERPKNVNIKTYLRRFDLVYKDTDKQSVFFRNITVSSVNVRDYVYVQVIFDAEYNSINKVQPKSKFKNYKRVVEIRAFKTQGKWNGYITYVGFYNPYKSLPTNKKDNNELAQKNKFDDSSKLPKIQKTLPIKVDIMEYKPKKLVQSNSKDNTNTKQLKSDLEIHLDEQIQKTLDSGDYNGASIIAQHNIDAYMPKYMEAKKSNDEKKQADINYIICYSYLWKSYISLMQGNNEDAITIAQKGLIYNLDYADLHYIIGIAYAIIGGIGESKKQLSRTIKIKHDYSIAYVILSKIHSKKNKNDEAFNTLNGFIEKFGEYNESVLKELAYLYEQQNNYVYAEIYYKKAYKVNPKKMSNALSAANMSLKQEKYPDTISYLNSQKNKNRDLVKSHLYHSYLGEAYYLENDKKNAITHLEKAIDLKGDNPNTYLYLINIEKNINKIFKTIETALQNKIFDNTHLDKVPDKIKRKSQFQKLKSTYL